MEDVVPTSDPYTSEWYRKRFQLMEHQNKQLSAEIVECIHHERMLRKELDEALKLRREDVAKIGELTDTIDALKKNLTERMDKASNVIQGLQKKLKSEPVS